MRLNPGFCTDCGRIASRGPHDMCGKCACRTDGGEEGDDE